MKGANNVASGEKRFARSAGSSEVASGLKQCNEAIKLLVDLTEMIGDILCSIRHPAIDLAKGVRGWFRQKILFHPLSDSVF
jgi:hypothetical protein